MASETEACPVAQSATKEIQRNLLRQLHRTTQPLSVLQGSLELSLVEARTTVEYRDSIQLALEELYRVADCFESLRKMITIGENGEAARERLEGKDV